MGAGPARERPTCRPAGFQRPGFFLCPALRIGDAVQWWCLPGPLKPSLAAVSLALPGQTAPSRHHHCPAHLAAEPPRVSSTLSERAPGPFYEARIVGACLASEMPACRPAGSQRLMVLLSDISGILPGASLPFAGGARLYGFPAGLKKETCRGGGTRSASDRCVQTVGDMAPPRTFKRR